MPIIITPVKATNFTIFNLEKEEQSDSSNKSKIEDRTEVKNGLKRHESDT